jgi:hypothetical protein
MPQQPDDLCLKIHAVLEGSGPLTRSKIIEELGGCTLPQFHAAIASLMRGELVVKTGRTKGTRYMLAGSSP